MSSAAVAAPLPTLQCRLSGPAQVTAGQPVVLQMAIHNAGAQPISLLVWGTPFEARWFAPYVGVQRGGVDVPYRGASAKRGDPSPTDYVRIEPAQSREASVDLSAAFNVQLPGRYRVQPRILLQDLVAGGLPSGAARQREQHQGAALDCNALEFDVSG